MNSFEVVDLIDELRLAKPTAVESVIWDGQIVIDFGEYNGIMPIFLQRTTGMDDAFWYEQYQNDEVSGDITGLTTAKEVAAAFWAQLLSTPDDNLPDDWSV